MRLLPAVFSMVFLFSGCGKTPESQTARKIGEQPKQTIDKVTADVNKAMQKGVERRQGAEQQQEAEKKE